MPAALPARTTISRVARTEVCAGAIRVSRSRGWPSATTETQEGSVARISRLNVGGALATGAGAEDLATGALSSESPEFAAGLFVDDGRDGGAWEGLSAVASARVGAVLGTGVPAAVRFPVESALPAVSEAEDAEGWARAGAGAGPGGGDGCEEA